MERIAKMRRIAAVGILVAATSWWPTAVAAQAGTGEATVMDTTIQPGHLDFSRYDTPSACVQATRVTTSVVFRAAVDTAVYAPERDTLPTAAVTVARRCGARFSAAAVPQRELLSLVQLSLVAGRNDVARAAGDRWVSLITDPNERGWAMYRLVQAYVNIHPSQFAEAERIVARMDSMGKSAIAPRINAHSLLMMDAERRFDIPRIEREGLAALSIDPLLVGEERNDVEYGSGNVVFSILWAELYRSPEHAVANLMQAARSANYKWGTDTASIIKYLTTLLSPIGHPIPPLSVKYWYGQHGPEGWVVPGKVTLLFVDQVFGVGQYERYAMIRRLHEKYGDAVNVTILTRTVGYIHDSSPLAPVQEADSIRSYYHDFLKLPVTVGVEETPFQFVADGRRLNGATASEQVGLYNYSPLLVDQSGKLVVWGESSDAGLEGFIDKALHKQSQQ